MTGRIEALGSRVRLSGPAERELNLDEAVRERWACWTATYWAVTGPVAPGTLLALGRELFDWLNAGEWARTWADAGGARQVGTSSAGCSGAS